MTELAERNESRILKLETENDSKSTRIDELEKSLEEQNELITKLYNKSQMKPNSTQEELCVFVWSAGNKGENTDDIMIRVAKDKLGIDIRVEDIDRSHRTGPSERKTAISTLNMVLSQHHEYPHRQPPHRRHDHCGHP